MDRVEVDAVDIPGHKLRVIAGGVDTGVHGELVRRASMDILQLNRVFAEMKQFKL